MPGLRRAAAIGALALLAMPVGAHGDASPVAFSLRWSLEPWVLGALAVSLWGYGRGARRLHAHAGEGRVLGRREQLAFAGGWLALVVALVSPLDPLGVQLFSAHMLQHEAMMVVAAPLLCLARPLVAWTWALPPPARRGAGRIVRSPAWAGPWRVLSSPLGSWSVHALVLWGWHLPALFDRALHDEGLHTLQHLSFLGSALLFWWAVFKPTASRGQQGAALVYLFTTMVHTAALGALLTLSAGLWYPSYGPSTSALGLDPLEDQQLGGLVMWVPAGAAYFVAGLALAVRWAGLGGRPAARA